MLETFTLDQLRGLIAVIEEGSFSAAARKLHRVESAISASMANLESQLGVPLWDRSTKVARLKSYGAIVHQVDPEHVAPSWGRVHCDGGRDGRRDEHFVATHERADTVTEVDRLVAALERVLALRAESQRISALTRYLEVVIPRLRSSTQARERAGSNGHGR